MTKQKVSRKMVLGQSWGGIITAKELMDFSVFFGLLWRRHRFAACRSGASQPVEVVLRSLSKWCFAACRSSASRPVEVVLHGLLEWCSRTVMRSTCDGKNCVALHAVQHNSHTGACARTYIIYAIPFPRPAFYLPTCGNVPPPRPSENRFFAFLFPCHFERSEKSVDTKWIYADASLHMII